MAANHPGSSGKTLNEQFVEDVLRMPDGEKLKTCIQCGTCSASCPTSDEMDYTPRQIIAYFRAGMLDKILRSNTVWMCASCYSCAARCPSGIKFTDLMYELKRLALQHGIEPREGKEATILTEAFVDTVKEYGRNPETKFMIRFTMRTGKFVEGLKQLPLAWKMRQRGRLDLGAKPIRGVEDLQKIMAAVEAEEGSE
ncbi:MAG: 4Fe-4S dicluster domain-containing protein [Armatimonadota bacterium]|jgi:heterodisulfide reductase subunit C